MAELHLSDVTTVPSGDEDGGYGFFFDDIDDVFLEEHFPFLSVLANATADPKRIDGLSAERSYGNKNIVVERLRQDASRISNTAEEHPTEDNPPPEWVVVQGSSTICDSCRCRLVYCGRKTAPGHVFSRSFYNLDRNNSAQRSVGSTICSIFSSSTSSLGMSRSPTRACRCSSPQHFLRYTQWSTNSSFGLPRSSDGSIKRNITARSYGSVRSLTMSSLQLSLNSECCGYSQRCTQCSFQGISHSSAVLARYLGVFGQINLPGRVYRSAHCLGGMPRHGTTPHFFRSARCLEKLTRNPSRLGLFRPGFGSAQSIDKFEKVISSSQNAFGSTRSPSVSLPFGPFTTEIRSGQNFDLCSFESISTDKLSMAIGNLVNRPTAAALGGFRVRAGKFGQEWAEFEFVVSSGCQVYRAWRRHDDVSELVETVGLKLKAAQMAKSYVAWEMVERHHRIFFSATEVVHLIETRSRLESFFEHLLNEIDSPTHLLNFTDDYTWRCNTDKPACRCAYEP